MTRMTRILAPLFSLLLLLSACAEGEPFPVGHEGDPVAQLPDDDDATSDDDDSTVTDDDDATEEPTPSDDDDATATDDDDSTATDDDDATSDDDDSTVADDDDTSEEPTPAPDDDDSTVADDDDTTDEEEPTPAPTEVCNGLDDDGDGQIDEGFDADVDGVTTCAGDCNDANPVIHIGAPESCDAIDNDCDGSVDEGCPPPVIDNDGDGYTVGEGDCDDTDASIHPGATELCNGEDDDCNGSVYPIEGDQDADGQMPCEGDCNDFDADVFTGAPEVCNGMDDNCNGLQLSSEIDNDGDGFVECTPVLGAPEGFLGGDCSDANSAIHPGAPELCDGVDNDCDGSVDEGCFPPPPPPPPPVLDVDGDGYDEDEDCDDFNASVHPGATELCNGEDDDCDGSVDESCPPPASNTIACSYTPNGNLVVTISGAVSTALMTNVFTLPALSQISAIEIGSNLPGNVAPSYTCWESVNTCQQVSYTAPFVSTTHVLQGLSQFTPRIRRTSGAVQWFDLLQWQATGACQIVEDDWGGLIVQPQ